MSELVTARYLWCDRMLCVLLGIVLGGSGVFLLGKLP